MCKQLGYSTSNAEVSDAYYGQGSGIIWLDHVSCHGDESRLSDCDNDGWGISACTRGDDVGVDCGKRL